jgi:hypothetical protein
MKSWQAPQTPGARVQCGARGGGRARGCWGREEQREGGLRSGGRASSLAPKLAIAATVDARGLTCGCGVNNSGSRCRVRMRAGLCVCSCVLPPCGGRFLGGGGARRRRGQREGARECWLSCLCPRPLSNKQHARVPTTRAESRAGSTSAPAAHASGIEGRRARAGARAQGVARKGGGGGGGAGEKELCARLSLAANGATARALLQAAGENGPVRDERAAAARLGGACLGARAREREGNDGISQPQRAACFCLRASPSSSRPRAADEAGRSLSAYLDEKGDASLVRSGGENEVERGSGRGGGGRS